MGLLSSLTGSSAAKAAKRAAEMQAQASRHPNFVDYVDVSGQTHTLEVAKIGGNIWIRGYYIASNTIGTGNVVFSITNNNWKVQQYVSSTNVTVSRISSYNGNTTGLSLNIDLISRQNTISSNPLDNIVQEAVCVSPINTVARYVPPQILGISVL